ncbi:MAG: hypothetical protein JWM46_524 [Candidatus Kaiserbacteria bacterium]|nr:hypothetical protein [Candidatus Kaiserbacteria bacterium]
MWKLFVFPSAVALVAAAGIWLWGGVQALILVALLAVLETTLSFDNAVVNAKVLSRMNPLWQSRFMLWGIPVAVFGTRLILPLFIVAAAAALSPIAVAKLALFDSRAYGAALQHAHAAIAAFGATFLMLVSLKYFFDRKKTVHWIKSIERHFSRWGGIEAIEIGLVLSILLTSAFFASYEAATILSAGVIGMILFIIMEGFTQSFELDANATRAGLSLFIYLNVLDSAFSLDGVVGAFAITSLLPVIIAGLGIGALYVRAFTVSLVRAKTLETLPYLEHGAHYAIFALALTMLASLYVDVPEVITGLIGFVFIALAYWSSREERITQRR